MRKRGMETRAEITRLRTDRQTACKGVILVDLVQGPFSYNFFLIPIISLVFSFKLVLKYVHIVYLT